MTPIPASYDRLTQIVRRLLDNSPGDLDGAARTELSGLMEAVESEHLQMQAQIETLQQTLRELESDIADRFDLYDRAPVAFVALDHVGAVKQVNARARRLLAGNPDQLIGQPFNSFIAHGEKSAWFRRLQQLAKGAQTGFFDLTLKSVLKQPIMVQITVIPTFDARHRHAGWLLAFFDVSRERRQAEELQWLHLQMELAARAANLGVLSLDVTKGKECWNEQVYRLVDLAPGSGTEPAGRFFDFIHPDDRQGLLSGLEAMLAQAGSDIHEEFRIRRPDGGVRWMIARGRIYRDGRGAPATISSILYDISARKEIEAQKQNAQEQLARHLAESRRLNEELAQYAYALSHDLKEPLRAIRNYADFLYEDLFEAMADEDKQYLQGLKTAVVQGESLITDLLNFSRLEGEEPIRERVDVGDLIGEIRSGLTGFDGTTFAVHGHWPVLTLDRALLRQVLQNLISNAIKFGNTGGRWVEIGWQDAEADDRIEIYVRDNGIGIDPAHREKIFGIFQRLHTRQEYEGTGIGLAIVRKAAHLLGGTVRVESRPGEGSTFYVNLPRTRDNSADAGDPEPESGRQPDRRYG